MQSIRRNKERTIQLKGSVKATRAAAFPSSKAPNAKDVQWLSDGYDELHSANDRVEERLSRIELRLHQMAEKVSHISKAVDEIQQYSYQYNVKIVGAPQAEGTTESTDVTVKKCLDFVRQWSQRERI